MKLDPRQLSLYNVIQFSAELDKSKPLLDQIDETGDYFKKILMENGYYTSGPVVFSYNPEVMDSSLYIMTSIGNKVEISENDLEHFAYVAHFELDTSYWYRHFDIDQEIPYEALKQKIANKNQRVTAIYHVILRFYGEVMLDLYYDVEDI